MKVLIVPMLVGIGMTSANAQQATDWKPVDAALGRTGAVQSGDVYRVGMPRGDMEVDTAGVAKALGYAGRVNGGGYQVNVPRKETIRDAGMEVPASRGVATAINFQPTGGGKAAITGDFVLRADEVNPVIRTLRGNGIEVTALHSHMLNEEPRLYFMHFWANDDALKLARALRGALDNTASNT